MSELYRWALAHAHAYVVAVVHVGAVLATLLPLRYFWTTWSSRVVGRALMLSWTSVALLFDVAVAGYWWPFPGYPLVYAAIVTLVVASLGYQLAVLVWRQRVGTRRPDPAGSRRTAA